MTHNSNIDDLDKILEHWLKMIKAAVIIQRANQAVDNIDEVLVAEAKQAIQQLLDEAYKKGYIDGGISEITK